MLEQTRRNRRQAAILESRSGFVLAEGALKKAPSEGSSTVPKSIEK
jgi:hypothetical protein